MNNCGFYNSNGLKNTSKIDLKMQEKDFKGRKTFVFWTLIFLLIFLALGNLILTFTILGTLRLGYGMNSLELIQDDSAIKLYGDIDFNHVYKTDGKINTFSDVPLELGGVGGGGVYLNLVGKNGRPMKKISMDLNGTFIHNIDKFLILTPENSHYKTINFFKNPQFSLKNKQSNLNVKLTSTNRIISLKNSSLDLKSDRKIYLSGIEGTNIESKRLTFSADQNISLKSLNGSLKFDSNKIYLDLKNLAKFGSLTNLDGPINSVITQYKLCICSPHGKIFKLPVLQGQKKINCNHVKMIGNSNPCI